jgi:DNA-binding transcriptional MerR regulator
MNHVYRVHEFAALAGVTIKALHHYDRLGLLKPRRSDAGYRVYSDRDLERLEQIVALKFIGLPLKRIRALLEQGAPTLREALRLQRSALEDQQRRLGRALDALRAAETDLPPTGAADASVLRRLIEAITMEDNTEILKTYFGEAAWDRWKTRRSPDATREWDELYRGLDAALNEDIRSDHARALAERWLALVEREIGGDAKVRTGLIRSWIAGHPLPALLHRGRHDDAKVASATRFVADVLWAKRDDERRAQPAATARHKASESRIALVHRIVAALDTDPTGPEAQALAAAWHHLLKREGGDEEGAGKLATAWRTQRQWPVGLRNYIASLHNVTPETWDRVVDFINAAAQASAAVPPQDRT